MLSWYAHAETKIYSNLGLRTLYFTNANFTSIPLSHFHNIEWLTDWSLLFGHDKTVWILARRSRIELVFYDRSANGICCLWDLRLKCWQTHLAVEWLVSGFHSTSSRMDTNPLCNIWQMQPMYVVLLMYFNLKSKVANNIPLSLKLKYITTCVCICSVSDPHYWSNRRHSLWSGSVQHRVPECDDAWAAIRCFQKCDTHGWWRHIRSGMKWTSYLYLK